MELNPDRLRKECRALVQSSAVEIVLEGLKVRLYNAWLSSNETSARETIHAEARGLESLMTTLKNIAESEPEQPA